jgi:hypothetical protein
LVAFECLLPKGWKKKIAINLQLRLHKTQEKMNELSGSISRANEEKKIEESREQQWQVIPCLAPGSTTKVDPNPWWETLSPSSPHNGPPSLSHPYHMVWPINKHAVKETTSLSPLKQQWELSPSSFCFRRGCVFCNREAKNEWFSSPWLRRDHHHHCVLQ